MPVCITVRRPITCCSVLSKNKKIRVGDKEVKQVNSVGYPGRTIHDEGNSEKEM